MSLTGDYLSAQDALRAGLVTEVVPHDQLLPAARKVADSIVGNNQDAVRALLSSYHRIDESQTSEGLWLEATAAKHSGPPATTSPPTVRPSCSAAGLKFGNSILPRFRRVETGQNGGLMR